MIATSPFGPEICELVPLARHTSLRVGGPARYYLESADLAVIGRGFAAAVAADLPTLVLGGGSNLLVADAGFDGLAIKYTADAAAVAGAGDGTGLVTASAGLAFANLARRLARDGWAGLEWASNVPGTIGGAAVNNAGAFGKSMADDLVSLELLQSDGRTGQLDNPALDYAYRTSVLKRGELGPVLVTNVRCAVHRDDPERSVGRIADFQRLRSETQPRQLSAGSVFANPAGDFAGRLIEAAGLKGTRVGGAEISSQHANFIVNLGRGGRGGATAGDVYALVRMAQDAVWARAGVWLRPEIQLVGAWAPEQLRALLGPSADRRGRQDPE